MTASVAKNGYLGIAVLGLAAKRPTLPDVDPSNTSFFYATDTGVLSVWNGTAWVTLGTAGVASVQRNPNLAATGTNLATAAQLLPGFTVVTAADGAVGVALPATPVAGTVVEVKNVDAANAVLKVWPDAAATINAIGSNGAISLAAKVSAIFIADSTTQWYTIPLLPS